MPSFSKVLLLLLYWINLFIFLQFRLKKCGLQNLIYLVESHKHDKHAVLLLSTLQQAAVNTQIVDGFTVKYTDNHRESMVYLATLTNVFKRKLNVSDFQVNLFNPILHTFYHLINSILFIKHFSYYI